MKKILKKVKVCMNKKRYGEILYPIENKSEYKTFIDAQESESWGMEHYFLWSRKYVDTMKIAKRIRGDELATNIIECYCGYSYKHINQYLRFGDDMHNQYRELSNTLSIVLCSAPRIPIDIIVYRLVDYIFIGNLIANNKGVHPSPIIEKGFMSTSLLKTITKEDEPYANTQYMLKIYIPKDTVGIYVNAITKRNEEEMLLCLNMYLSLADYPYRDKETGKIMYECKLHRFY